MQVNILKALIQLHIVSAIFYNQTSTLKARGNTCYFEEFIVWKYCKKTAQGLWKQYWE